MEKQTANINVRMELKINGMTIDEFQKEIGKLSNLLGEMKQLSLFRDEANDLTSGNNNGACLDNMPGVGAVEIHGWPYRTTWNNEVSVGKAEGAD